MRCGHTSKARTGAEPRIEADEFSYLQEWNATLSHQSPQETLGDTQSFGKPRHISQRWRLHRITLSW